jgi:hypothetical protein
MKPSGPSLISLIPPNPVPKVTADLLSFSFKTKLAARDGSSSNTNPVRSLFNFKSYIHYLNVLLVGVQ